MGIQETDGESEVIGYCKECKKDLPGEDICSDCQLCFARHCDCVEHATLMYDEDL